MAIQFDLQLLEVISFPFLVPFRGLEEIWFIGDAFIRETVSNLLSNTSSYTKTNFEATAFCASRSTVTTSSIKNPIARIHNALVAGMQRSATLPKMIIIILEDDILSYLDHNDYGATEMYGKIITYLESEIQKSILNFKSFMPKKAKRVGCPHFVWIAPSSNSSYANNNL